MDSQGNKPIKVTISVAGRFHAFDLARQLSNRGMLHRLITSYPKFKAMEWDISKNKIKSILSHELINRGWNKLPHRLKSKWDPTIYLNNRFDKLSKGRIPQDTDIYIGWSGASYNSLCQAKKYGAITILERGSTHISFQTDILTEEYKKFGYKPQIAPEEIIQKEINEYSFADYISIPSQFVKSTFIQYGVSSEKLLVNPYGVDLSSFYPALKQDKKFRIIFCGNLTLQKGVHYLIQAFTELNLNEAELWLIGSIQPEIISFLKNSRSHQIHLKGTYPQSKLYSLYSQGSVFCMASIQEGLAMVIPQAMACGLPVICTPNSGGEELIEDGKNGFIIPIRDVEALKEKIMILYKNPGTCKEMGLEAIEKIKNGFSWDDYGNRAVKSYSQLKK